MTALTFLCGFFPTFVGVWVLLNWLAVRGKPQPKPGDIWQDNFGTGGDPWAKPRMEIEIVDVRDGWVQYRFTKYPGASACSQQIADLRKYWRRVSP